MTRANNASAMKTSNMMLNSGSAAHMVKEKSMFTEKKRGNIEIELGDAPVIHASHKETSTVT